MNIDSNFFRFFSIKRCPARCKTSPDGRSIKFVNLNHNHGPHTGLKDYKPKAPVFKITEIKKEFADHNDGAKNGDATTNGGGAKNTN